MYNTKVSGKKGIRCKVCTGCGRCRGVERMHILTKRMQPIAVDLRNDRKERLITADVGTTTIAMQLHGVDGSVSDTFVAVNPQTVYGADVISRIAAAGKAVASGGDLNDGVLCPAADMQRMVLEVLEKGIRRFQMGLKDEENLCMVLAANTTMVYLLLGHNPAELGRAPFKATHLEATETRIGGVPTYILPGLSAFVGGDITAGIHASGMLTSAKPILLVDLGTNGEIVLGNREKVLACATAAGPAFEGGVNRGVWGADMVSLLASLRREGVLDANGLLSEPYFENGIRIGNVCVTQASVRAVQLAKAAIAAGIDILCKQYGCTYEDIEQVILAGGFGYYLNPQDAAELGLLRTALAEKTVAGGNTALTGALCVGEKLLKRTESKEWKTLSWTDIKRSGCKVTVVNLAEQAEFEKVYLASMLF